MSAGGVASVVLVGRNNEPLFIRTCADARAPRGVAPLSRDARAPLSRSRQEAFDAHLERLDVDAELCSFICMFADHKEHREYVQWMEAVKRAVEE